MRGIALKAAALLIVGLSAYASIPLEYRSVALAPYHADDAGHERGSGMLRVYFSSPLELSGIAFECGLTCDLVFPDLEDVRGWGGVFRDLTDPVWSEHLPLSPYDQPETYYYHADIQLMKGPVGWSDTDVRSALAGRQFARAELTVFVPGVLWRGSSSDPLIIPSQDILPLLPDETPQPAGRVRTASTAAHGRRP